MWRYKWARMDKANELDTESTERRASAGNVIILPTGIKSEGCVNSGIKRHQGRLNQCLHLGGIQPE